jgi:hypothetical protein
LERPSVEPAVKETVGEKSDSGSCGESPKERKSNDKKRVKTPPRKHVCPRAESELDTSVLIKENVKKEILSKGKNFTEILESLSSYTSMKKKNKYWAIELFKSYGFEDNTISILFKSLAHSTLLSYQFG